MKALRANAYKRWLLSSLLALLLLLAIGKYIRPNVAVHLVHLTGSVTSSGPGFFSALFSAVDNVRREIHAESLKMLSGNATWRGRPLFPIQRKLKSSFWLESDVDTLRKELVRGAVDIFNLSKFPMNDYAEDWEWEVLNKPAMTVATDAGNGTTSLMSIVNKKSVYRAGDVITVRVDIRDGTGKQKTTGGDQVRVWIVDAQNEANQASHVTDMANGSYISAVPLSWAGTVNIRASLVYNAEIQRAHFFIRNVAKTTKVMAAGFSTAFSSELTLCSPFPIVPNSRHLCNFSAENGGLPWFCGKPINSGLDCRHWKYILDNPFSAPLPLTQAERTWTEAIGKSEHQKILPEITIRVESQAVTSNQPSKPRCGNLPLEDSWTSASPKGFFKHKIWHPLTCTLPVRFNSTVSNCLRNTTFLMLGDSNLRLAFQILTNKIQCELNTGTVKPRWHSPLQCVNTSTESAVHWKPHGLPFHLGYGVKFPSRYDVKQPHEYIDEIPNHGSFVVLIHLYFHLTPYHYSVFTSQVKAIRKSVKKLVMRNPNVKVIFRGPHAASHFNLWYGVRGGDLAGLHYVDIVRREFKGLYDRVLFVLPWDMTVAMENVDFHPPPYVNEAIMNLVLDYVCHAK